MKREELVQTLRRAASALLDLLRRLETDGYLKTAEGDPRIVGTILHEMAAYAVSVSVRSGTDREEAIRRVMQVFLLEEEELENRIRNGVRERAVSFTAVPEEIPSCYRVLDRFDKMALEYDGAFYEKLKVPSPGRLADHYLDLLTGFGRVIAEDEDLLRKPVWTETMERLKAVQAQALL